jgi:exodeoxyribonuclease VII small subunit
MPAPASHAPYSSAVALTGIAQVGYFQTLFKRFPTSGCEAYASSPGSQNPLHVSSDAKTLPPPASFEAAMAELESIVASMETGDLSLAASLAAYRRGAELLQYCQSALKDAEQQVQVLERGVLQPFIADTASSAESDDEP